MHICYKIYKNFYAMLGYGNMQKIENKKIKKKKEKRKCILKKNIHG